MTMAEAADERGGVAAPIPGWDRPGLENEPRRYGLAMTELREPVLASPDFGTYTDFEKAQRVWGTAHIKSEADFVSIRPLGSRRDGLLFWKSGGRVCTGGGRDRACFEGSIEDFEKKLEDDYGDRLRRVTEKDGGEHYTTLTKQFLDDYRATRCGSFGAWVAEVR